jgi:hypothetical protein
MGSLAASAAPITNASLIASRASNLRTAPLQTASVAVRRSLERRKPARSAPSVVRVDLLVDSKGRPAGPPITMARSWRNSVPLRSSWTRRAPSRGAIGKPGRCRCAGSQPRQDAPGHRTAVVGQDGESRLCDQSRSDNWCHGKETTRSPSSDESFERGRPGSGHSEPAPNPRSRRERAKWPRTSRPVHGRVLR